MFDKTLVKKILNGDRGAGETFVTLHYARIYRMLHCLTGSTETARDLTQQTFARAWQALASYRGKAKLATWLHRIAYREYTQWLRSHRNHLPLEAVAELADLRTVRGLDTILVAGALAQLADELRETFLLYYVQELSVAEAAEILDVPPGTVKSRLFTARHRLRELLNAGEAPVPPIDVESGLRYSGSEGGHLP